MGHVRRRKLEGGRTAYLARYRGPDGRERSKQFAKRSDAERFLSVAEVTKAEDVHTVEDWQAVLIALLDANAV